MPTESNSPSGGNEMNDVAVITLENISVDFQMPNETVSGIKEYVIRLAQRRLTYHSKFGVEKYSVLSAVMVLANPLC